MRDYHLANKDGTLLAIVTAESPEAAIQLVNEGFRDQIYYIDEVLSATN